MKRKLIPIFPLNALLLFITCLFTNLNSYSQVNKDYSLLWEIKGNGLSKPSYIFGSINYRDHRAFNFSDSVYIAIANSSAFALETHPDTLAKYLANPANNITYSTDQNKPKRELKGANLTFPSHFLYGTARTLNKNFYGLANGEFDEIDTEDVDDDNEEFNEDLDALLSIYTKGNLNDIHNELQQYYEDDYFNERNTQLTAAIINLIKNETLFASVAAILLPGENGILAKLKKAGYEVRPVEGNFTDLSKTYTIDFEKMKWQTYNDKIFNFSVQFPSAPFLSKNMQAKMIVYQDPVNYVAYTASALYTGPLTGRTSEQYVDTVIATYSKSDKVKVSNITKYKKHGSTVVEVTFTGEKNYSRSKLIHVNGTYYSFTVESKNDIINEPFVNKFFNSVEIMEPAVINQNEWVDYKNSLGGFKVKLPTTPQEQKQRIENPNSPEHPYFFTIYQAADRASLMNYIIRYSDFPKGMYLADKNLIFNTLIKDFENKGKIVVKPKTIIENGVEGITLDLIISDSYMQIKAFIKGNRTYMLISQNMKEPLKPKDDIFFKTFKINQELNTTVIPFEIGNFVFGLPNNASLFPNSKDEIEEQKNGESFLFDEQSYFTLNNYTGGVYGIEKSTISKYYKNSNPDTLLHTIANELSAKGNIKELTLNNYKAFEYITADSLAKTFKKSRIWFDGNNCYLQTLIADKDEIESSVAETFFNSTRLNSKLSLFDFDASKAQLIADDLASQHEPTHLLALGAITFYDFEKDELPYIYKAINRKYTDDTTINGTRYKLIKVLEELNDKETINVLKKLYQESKGLDLLQSKILSISPYVDSSSFDWYFKNLSNNPPFKIDNYWQLFNPLVDSLSFVSANFEEILKIGENKVYRPMVLSLISNMLEDDQNGAYILKIEQNKNYIENYALEDLDEDIDRIIQSKYIKTTNYYLSILQKLNLLPLTDKFTTKLIQIDSVPHIKTSAIATRIIKGLTVDEKLINEQLDNLQSRYVTMSAFNQACKIDLVPIKYREHHEFAKLILSDFLAEEHDYPESLNLLGSVKEDSKTFYAFDFTYMENGEKKTYIGISGPFDEEKNLLKFGTYGAYSNFDLIDKDWLKQAKSLIEIFNSDN